MWEAQVEGGHRKRGGGGGYISGLERHNGSVNFWNFKRKKSNWKMGKKSIMKMFGETAEERRADLDRRLEEIRAEGRR
jgi:hypothetical protein